MEKDDFEHPKGWKITLSIVASVGWLIFLILWLAFYADGYVVYQNIAIVLISILVLIVVLGTPWAVWGVRHIPEEGKEMMRTSGFKSRVASSIIVPFVFLIFLILWFFFYASDFNIYQNIAIFLVSILIVGGAMGAIWSSWGMKHGEKFEKEFKKEKKKKS